MMMRFWMMFHWFMMNHGSIMRLRRKMRFNRKNLVMTMRFMMDRLQDYFLNMMFWLNNFSSKDTFMFRNDWYRRKWMDLFLVNMMTSSMRVMNSMINMMMIHWNNWYGWNCCNR